MHTHEPTERHATHTTCYQHRDNNHYIHFNKGRAGVYCFFIFIYLFLLIEKIMFIDSTKFYTHFENDTSKDI